MTPRVRRLLPWALVLAPLGLLPFGACGDSPVAPDAGPQADAVASDGAYATSEAPPTCTAPVLDGGVPDGWVLEKTFSECCGFYVPPTKDLLPSPIEWEACPPRAMAVLPPGASCKALKVTWDPPPDMPGADGDGYVDQSSGKVYMMTSRLIDKKHSMIVLAEADGPVLSALFEGGDKCLAGTSTLQSFGAGNWAFEVFNRQSKQEAMGFIAGRADSMIPQITGRIDGGYPSIGAGGAGALHIDDLDRFWLYDLAVADAGPTMIASAAQDQQLQAIVNFFQDDIAWIAEGSVSMKVRLYHAGKTVNFIDYSGIDPEHGAGCLGGDGKDMVWVEGFGLENAGRYKKADYFTSPYTTDPSKLQPRRLRSDTYRVLDTVTTVVGCGYAARTESRSLRILRLSDGVSWVLPFSALDAGFENAIEWQRPFAVTCSEVFIRTERVPMRIEIGSLGPGIPPD